LDVLFVDYETTSVEDRHHSNIIQGTFAWYNASVHKKPEDCPHITQYVNQEFRTVEPGTIQFHQKNGIDFLEIVAGQAPALHPVVTAKEFWTNVVNFLKEHGLHKNGSRSKVYLGGRNPEFDIECTHPKLLEFMGIPAGRVIDPALYFYVHELDKWSLPSASKCITRAIMNTTQKHDSYEDVKNEIELLMVGQRWMRSAMEQAQKFASRTSS
jgi:hypothetical protein